MKNILRRTFRDIWLWQFATPKRVDKKKMRKVAWRREIRWRLVQQAPGPLEKFPTTIGRVRIESVSFLKIRLAANKT